MGHGIIREVSVKRVKPMTYRLLLDDLLLLLRQANHCGQRSRIQLEVSQNRTTDKLVGLKESTKGGSDDVEMVM